MSDNQPAKPKVDRGTVTPWTKEEIDAMSVITEQDIMDTLADSAPAMQALLTARPEKEPKDKK